MKVMPEHFHLPFESSAEVESCIHQLFEEQVARTPDATAVMQGHQLLSYGELNGNRVLKAALREAAAGC